MTLPLTLKSYLRWILIVISFGIISLILWNTYSFFQYFKAEERNKIETWSIAQTNFVSSLNDLDSELNAVVSHIVSDTVSITNPVMVIGSNQRIISIRQIDTTAIKNPKAYLAKLKLRFEQENNPIVMGSENDSIGTIYYGNSPLLVKLKYYPLALILIIILFGAVVFFFYKSSKIATQNKLWSGMAKETAHQIGTPLSSLIGWTELLRTEHVNPDYIAEIEKDIDKLLIITERFSKIGSLPTLEKSDVIIETIESYDYLKARFSKLIDFRIHIPNPPLYANLNKQLYSWTIENLVKNAIDAMKGKGVLTLDIVEVKDTILISISDTGKGLERSKFKKIFEPGYTSKKRGWGLGLSLAKRIIEDYHKGKIKVLSSEIDKGTTIQITLQKHN